jgi:4-hydroxy-tetrahydrodipicolinate synthase
MVNSETDSSTRRDDRLRGVWSPALTPLHQDLSIDRNRYIAHARWLLSEGCHGVTVFGTTGEATSFSANEREALLEELVSAGVNPARLIIGTGCAALSDTVRLTAHAVRQGCGNVLVVPPFFYKNPSEEGVYRSYAELIERVASDSLRLYLYHFPQLSAVPVTANVVERLRASYPGTVAGIKDSSGDWDNTCTMIEAFPDLAIFPGSESRLLEAVSEGAAGCITATANVNPAGIRRVYDEWKMGAPNVQRTQERATTLRRTIEVYPLAPALKLIQAHYRDEPAWLPLRPPLVNLNEDSGSALVDALARLNFSL